MHRQGPEPDSGTPDTKAAPGSGILVVEDEYLIATDVRETLQRAGFEVVGLVSTGEEALDIAAREHPALAVVDVRLGGPMDGIETAAAMFRRHGVRSILATAHYDHGTWERAETLSSVGWLPKPYSMATLLLKVRSALRL